uniref:Uncharacterized protein n=1 Tax=Attheya septentrionalis TaxID=420275 RepID=A0A7S2XQB6_9STRA
MGKTSFSSSASSSASKRGSSEEVMQFRAVVPPNAKNGQPIKVKCPDGTEANVKLPASAKVGQEFLFELPAHVLLDPSSAAYQSNRGILSKFFFLEETITSSSSRGGKRTNHPRTSSSHPNDFFNRYGESITALIIGALLGLCIVTGFLSGILLVTRDDVDLYL